MATMWRLCPDCGGKQPCQIGGVIERDEASKRARVSYSVSCKTCGYVYPTLNDMDEALAEAKVLRGHKKGT